MPSNKEAVIQVVESAGEIGVAGVSARLRLDKGTVRKVALEAAREGRIGVRNDGQGYVFFSIGSGPTANRSRQVEIVIPEKHMGENLSAPYRSLGFPRSTGSVIEGRFKEIPPEAPSNSRSLVVAGQPYDSRTADALRQHAEAKRRALLRTPAGQAMGQEVIRTWNTLYGSDRETEAALQRAEFARAEVERTRPAGERGRSNRPERG